MASIPSERYVLSFGSLEKILNGENLESAILQILGYKQIPGGNNNRFRLLLNDGVVLFPFAVLTTQLNNLIHNKCLEKYTIFRLKDYAHSELIANKKVIICLDIEILVPGSEVNEKISAKNITENPCGVTELNTSVNISSASSSSLPVSSEPCPSTSDVAPNWDTVHSNVIISPSTANEIAPICSLSPYRSKWTIKARVTYKTPIISYNNSRGHGKYFSAYLLDESGEIKATAFNENAERFHNLLEFFKIYIISNADVKPARGSIIKNDFEITFECQTKVESCISDDSSVPMPTFNFKTISEISSLPKDSYTDVIGICDQISNITTIVTKSQNKEICKRNFFLIDKSKISITVTLWGALAESFPTTGTHVIAIKNAKVTYFRGSVLNANSMSMVYIDPNIDSAIELRAWFQSENFSLSQSITFRNFEQESSENWKTFAEIFTHDKINIPVYHTTKAMIVKVRKNNCLYKACSTAGCLKKVNELNDLYTCNKCNINSNTFNWVLFLSFQVADFTGSHWVLAFKETAEDLIGLTSDELNRIKTEDLDKYYDILDRLNLKSFIFKMRSSFEVYNEDPHLKSSVLSFSPVESVWYTKNLLAGIKKMSRMLNMNNS